MSDRCKSLESAYFNAEYEVDFRHGSLVFTIGEAIPQLIGRPFALITAYNPGHHRPTPEANEAANQRLAAELARAGHETATARARSRDGSHFEPSFAVFGMALEEAVAAAGTFGQAAIVWFDGTVARLVWVPEAIRRSAP